MFDFEQLSVYQKEITELRSSLEEISKMLFGLIKRTTIKTPLETRSRTRSFYRN